MSARVAIAPRDHVEVPPGVEPGISLRHSLSYSDAADAVVENLRAFLKNLGFLACVSTSWTTMACEVFL
jgi:hypothetical protein